MYHVIVSNHSGAVISEKVLLDITSPPVIISLTESFSAIEGESVELAVSAVGTDPITYQWAKGGVALDGQTKKSLKI